MRTGWVCFALMTLGLALAVGPGLVTPTAARADVYPYQAQPLAADGILGHVDGDRDRVTFTSDDGRSLTLDTSQADITLLDGNRAGMTADLLSGMRVHVSGRLLAAGIAEVDQMRVLDDANSSRPRPVVTPGSGTRPAEIELRGTIDSIDTGRGTFVVHVKDHTRTVLLADNTDLSGLGRIDPNRFPVKPGDRVTVAGILQPDGTVLAGAISLSRTVSLPRSSPTSMGSGTAGSGFPRRVSPLIGRVSSASNRYTSRDIKIRLNANDREVKVKVPRGIPIQQGGRPISVHDLREDDEVRVTGTYDGSDFQASRIEVLRAAPN